MSKPAWWERAVEGSTCSYLFKLMQSFLHILLSYSFYFVQRAWTLVGFSFCYFSFWIRNVLLGYSPQVSQVMYKLAKKTVSLHKSKFITVSKSILEAIRETNSEKAVNEHRWNSEQNITHEKMTTCMKDKRLVKFLKKEMRKFLKKKIPKKGPVCDY